MEWSRTQVYLKHLPEMAKTNHDGVTANITFDDKGDLKGGAITVYRVERGQWVLQRTIGGPAAAEPAPAAAPAK